jgi:hypothetical protein
MTEDQPDSTDASTRERDDAGNDGDRTDDGTRDDRDRTASSDDRDRTAGSDDRDRTASSDDRDRYEDRDRRGRGRGSGGFFGGNDLYERLQWVALVVLLLVAVATLFSFYTNVTRLISIWATRKYEPAIQAAFALAVLASALAGIAALSRNLR